MKQTFNLTYACGLHARPSTALVQLVKKFDAQVTIIKGKKTARADSILDVLSIGIQPGEVTFEVTGNDAEKVMEEIDNFINQLNVDQHW